MLYKTASNLSLALCVVLVTAHNANSMLPSIGPNPQNWKNGDKCLEFPWSGDQYKDWKHFNPIPFTVNPKEGADIYSSVDARISQSGRTLTINHYTKRTLGEPFDPHIDILDAYRPLKNSDFSAMFATVTFRRDIGEIKRNFYLPKVTSVSQKKCIASTNTDYPWPVNVVFHVAP